MSDTEDKYVRIMFDYSATAVWCSGGGNIEYSDIPISPGLALNLKRWTMALELFWAFYDEDSRSEDKDSQLKKDLRSFSVWGEQLAIKVKEELPDWTVVYYNEHEATYQSGNREDYEYEICIPD